MELRGKRVTVRKWKPDDAPNLARHADNPNVAENLRDLFPQPYMLSDAETWIGLCQNLPEGKLALAIDLNGEIIGAIGGEFKEDVRRRTFEIGYWLGEAHWRKGLASEALQLMCAHLFENTACVRIEAHVYEQNTASMALLEKNGFHLEGRQRFAVEKNGEMIDLFVFVRLHPDIEAGAGADPCDILSL